MGKIDDMRRVREAQHAAMTARSAAKPKVAAPESEPVADPVVPPATERASVQNMQSASNAQSTQSAKPAKSAKPFKPAKSAAAADEEFGECSECGKRKALASGLVVNHQKGFGKMCPGARKKPA